MLTTQLTLREYLDVLRRRRWIILLVTLATIALGVLPVALGTPTYASTAQLQVTAEQSTPFADRGDATVQREVRSVMTDVEALKSRGMRALVVERLGDDAELFDDVTATLIGFSEVIELRVTGRSPSAAADAANAYADVFVEERRRESNQALVSQASELRTRAATAQQDLAEIDRQLAGATDPLVQERLSLERTSLASQAQDYSRRADELEIEAALREGGIKVLSRATLQTDPISTSPLRAGFVAGVLGLLAGLALAVVLDIVQDRLSSRDELDSVAPDLSVLAAIPHMPNASDPSPEGIEAYRYLSTTIEFSRMRSPFRSMVVTSAVSDEGKTTTAVRLARAVAETDRRVVLVDADVRRTGVHRELGLDNRVGLTSILTGQVEAAEAIRYVEPNLAVIPAGPASAVANELVGSEDFAALLRDLSGQCDLLIVDAPPVLPVADPLLVARAVDVVLVVSRLGVVRRREVRATLRRLRDASLPVVGLVVNDVEPDRSYVSYHAPAADAEPAAPTRATA
jgi:capsular exopolysaccharide synthesis family protein